jgi:hypothetical protein
LGIFEVFGGVGEGFLASRKGQKRRIMSAVYG